MFRHKIHPLSLLVLVLWLTGAASCSFVCADDDHHTTDGAAEQHCVVHCACQAVADNPPAPSFEWQPPRACRVSSDTPLKRSRFIPDIFQPPRA